MWRSKQALVLVEVKGRARRLGQTQALFWASFLTIVILLFQLAGVLELAQDPISGPDYLAAASFVAARHQSGDPVIVAVPPPVYLVFESTADLVFLPSPIEAKRAQRYTRVLADGQFVDFWLGSPSIVSTEGLCELLNQSPNLWLVVDDTRLNADWAYLGPMADVIRGRTTEVFRGNGGVAVRRPVPDMQASADSLVACGRLPTTPP